jgi:hypothetical protein
MRLVTSKRLLSTWKTWIVASRLRRDADCNGEGAVPVKSIIWGIASRPEARCGLKHPRGYDLCGTVCGIAHCLKTRCGLKTQTARGYAQSRFGLHLIPRRDADCNMGFAAALLPIARCISPQDEMRIAMSVASTSNGYAAQIVSRYEMRCGLQFSETGGEANLSQKLYPTMGRNAD